MWVTLLLPFCKTTVRSVRFHCAVPDHSSAPTHTPPHPQPAPFSCAADGSFSVLASLQYVTLCTGSEGCPSEIAHSTAYVKQAGVENQRDTLMSIRLYTDTEVDRVADSCSVCLTERMTFSALTYAAVPPKHDSLFKGNARERYTSPSGKH